MMIVTQGIALISVLLAVSVCGQNFTAKNVDEMLIRNGCKCPCKPSAVKEYYIPISRSNDWFGAVAYCNSVKMEMAEVLHEDEAKLLRETIEEESDDPDSEFYWIGANDLGRQGSYAWTLSGRSVDFANWAPGEPNNAQPKGDRGPTERCAAVGKGTLKWNDFLCTREMKFVCQQFRDD